jgi:hypothetical protein
MVEELDTPKGFRTARWKRFRASIADLNAFVRPDVLRKYQSDILSTGQFEVVSPASDDVVQITQSVRTENYIAYPLPDDSDVWLIAALVALGYPICSAFRSRRKRIFPLMKLIKRQEQQIEQLDFQPLSNPPAPASEPDGRVALVIGHKNFAHHLWNELSALEEWSRQATPERIASLSILATDEPLGPLQDIFPELSTATLADPNSKSQEPIAVRVGSQLVTNAMRRKLRDFTSRHTQALVDHPAQVLLAQAWPRIWVSVRQVWRTADNFDEFFLAILRHVIGRYPNAAIFLDGFSFPFGFFDDPRTEGHRESFVARADEAGKEIIDLIRRAEERFGTAVASRICNVSGIDLPSAIAIGERCDYYICHYGTLQHKIAWVHNIPGMLHGPHSRGPKSDSVSARWHAAQVEDGTLPDVVPPSMISTEDAESRKKSWNLNYSFVDAEQAALFVVDLMQARLAWSADSVSPEAGP